jgi:hypothetical protein
MALMAACTSGVCVKLLSSQAFSINSFMVYKN